MHEVPEQPNVYSSTDLTYNQYLKVPELLQLQHPLSEPEHHDEMLFIIIHQAYELWFKLIIHELGMAAKFMDEGEPLRAHHFVNRTVEITKVLVMQIHILETMRPADFLKFRYRLNPASGFQSLQFREVEFFLGLKDRRYLKFFENRPEMISVLQRRLDEPSLRHHFYEMLRNAGHAVPANASDLEEKDEGREEIFTALEPIYREPDSHLETYLLAESLVALDEQIQLWREHHVRVVARTIGFRKGTGGSSGVGYLKSTAGKQAFPYLWEVRSNLED